MTDGASEARTLEALAHGARGYLDKALLTTFLARAVRVVDAGEAWVPRKMVARIMDRLAGLTTWAGKPPSRRPEGGTPSPPATAYWGRAA